MKTRKGLVEFDRKFTGDDDWLKDLTLTVKNVSDKPITFIDASLTLFKKGEADETDKVPVQLPFSYSSAREASVGGEGERAINPGDSVDIALGEESYALLQNLLAANGYPRTFSQVEVAVERVLFNDGTMWYKSFFFLRDPYNPSKWIRDKHFQKGGKYENVKPPGPDGENVPIIYHPPRGSNPGCGLSPPGARASPFLPATDFGTGILLSSTSTKFLLAHIISTTQLPQDCGSTQTSACNRPAGCYELDSWEKIPCSPAMPNCWFADDEVDQSAPGTGPGKLEYRRIPCRLGDEKQGAVCQGGGVCTCEYVLCEMPTPTPTPISEFPDSECNPVYPVPCPTGGVAPNTGEGLTSRPGLCCDYSPILIDVEGDGFALTGADEGVLFDFNGDGVRSRFSWTAAGSDDAWLTLDRDGDGFVTTGFELFGNFTHQPHSPAGAERHGFLALAEFDLPASADNGWQGGNGDGVIDQHDGVFDVLRLWPDTNHNGISEAGELHTLRELGLKSIGLDYRESRRVDQHGNRFRYRARVRDQRGHQLGRWAWDVFLIRSTAL